MKCCSGLAGEESSYEITRGKMEDFQEIAVSSSMLADHSPDMYYHQVHEAFKNYVKEE